MMKKQMLAVPFTVILFSGAAFAGEAGQQGFYAGMDVGQGRPGIAAVGAATLNKRSSTVVGGTLGYHFNQNVAVEGQFTGIGKVTTNGGATAKGDALSVAGIGTLPLSDKFSVYGKLGYARTKTKVSSGFGATGTSRSAPTYGVGLQYNISPMLGVRFGVDRYGLATTTVAGAKTKANANVTSLGVVFNF